ncbi:MAG: aldehyde dehydrogenase family protein [Propionibacteriaceae bacterium]|jgi:succinate-semialdehyde dehydrogenase/glutarate-semialdehyde dehydrogenase|nr:aldehyde dehydrogenase family protein [Propionibacteriaceae bacterium]
MYNFEELASLAAVTPTGNVFPVASPLDQSKLGDVPLGTAADIENAVAKARAAQIKWAKVPVRKRADVMHNIQAQFGAHRDDLLDLVHLENGKSRIHALEEFLDCLLTSGFLSANAAKILGTQHRGGAIPGLTSTTVRYQPKGVVGIISPWNYPLTLAASDAMAAITAGNAVVIKPDSETPFTALAVAKVFADAGLPDGLFQVVPGPGAVLGTPLIENIDHLMFTGSSATGRKVAAQAEARLISCSAELGGKNAMIVRSDADIPRAVEGAMNACFSSTGQLCVSIERIYVHEHIYDQYVSALVERTNKLVLSAADGWGTDLGPLVNQGHFDKVKHHVDQAVESGATVLAGGKPRPDLGPLFFEPTLLEGVTDKAEIYREETFGPVVAIYKVRDDQEAIEQVNDTEYGLNASIWTRDVRRGRKIAAELHAGTVNINEGYAATWGSVAAPMGGMGISGLGRRHGAEGLRGYCEPQTIAVQRLMNIAAPKGVDREVYADVMSVGSKYLHLSAVNGVRRLCSALAATGHHIQQQRVKPAVTEAQAATEAVAETAKAVKKGVVRAISFAESDTSGAALWRHAVPFKGARVVITGAGSGMGRLMAIGAAKRGASLVAIWDLSEERAQGVAKEVESYGAKALALAVDVTNQRQVAAAAKKTGDVDILINNAGVVGGRTLLEEPPAAVNRTIDVNLKALFWVTKAFLPGMISQHRGYVVTMASAAGLLGGAKMADYAASKFGAFGFNESLRNEMRQGKTGVGTMIVCPYYTKTGMFAGVKTKFPLLLPLLEPQKVADAVLDGVERGKKQIIKPWFVRTTFLLRNLPVSFLDAIADLFGINSSMSDFTGRSSDRV